MSDVSQIDGSAIRLKRESLGWAIADMASRACLSVKQIRQIEEGGMTAFYSESVKLTAARKVAGLLQMSEVQLFGQQLAPEEPSQPEESLLHDSVHVSSPEWTAHVAAAPAANPIMRSEALHVLAQPPEHVEEDTAHGSESPADLPLVAPLESNAPDVSQAIQSADSAPSSDQATSEETQPAGGNGYLLKIVALFLVALAAAALLRPQVLEDQSDAAAPPPAPAPMAVSPPAQVLPAAEQTNNGSAATTTATPPSASPTTTPPASAQQ